MKENIKIKGEAVITVCDMRSLEALALQEKIVNATGQEYRDLVSELHSKFFKRRVVARNLCPTVGRAVVAARLAGILTYTGTINYCALGTDSTTADNTDIALGAEVYRKLVSSKTFDDNIAYFSTFFTATETNGTYEEVGHFIDGAVGADTGQLFSRIEDSETAELPITKSNTESLTVDYRCTIS